MRFWKLKASRVEVLFTVDFRLRERLRSSPALLRLYRGLSRWLGLEKQAHAAASDSGSARTDSPGDAPPGDSLSARLAGIEWYHCIDLGDGVVTPGAFDISGQLQHYHLPSDLSGQRVLDIGTKDGFFAFEFEKRGAAEVVALDVDTYAELDWPPRILDTLDPDWLAEKMGAGFEVAHQQLGSRVIRHTENVYRIGPDSVGEFDFVFSGSYLLHLMNPQLALANTRRVTRGRALIVDQFNPWVPREFMYFAGAEADLCWWHFSIEALEKMILNAGFSQVTVLDRFPLKSVKGEMWHATFDARI